jgi:hypothetical protein
MTGVDAWKHYDVNVNHRCQLSMPDRTLLQIEICQRSTTWNIFYCSLRVCACSKHNRPPQGKLETCSYAVIDNCEYKGTAYGSQGLCEGREVCRPTVFRCRLCRCKIPPCARRRQVSDRYAPARPLQLWASSSCRPPERALWPSCASGMAWRLRWRRSPRP